MLKKIPSIWDKSQEGRQAASVARLDVPETPLPEHLLRACPPRLPEVSELDLVRHYTKLSQLNFAIDSHFSPLGSCTMKYNPRLNEAVAGHPDFLESHPLAGEDFNQGNLELCFRLQQALGEISGLPYVSLQPTSGAQGELAGVLAIGAFHRARGETQRKKFLLPSSAHGTNPATVAMAGFNSVEIPTNARGNIDFESFLKECDETLAGAMITNPNTLGLFEEEIVALNRAVHEAGGLVYGDGANMNAIMGIVRPSDLGFDIMHFNLHKTFSTPHGGGGPGAGPIATNETLKEFLPAPIVVEKDGRFAFHYPPQSIGRLHSFYGHFGVLVRALAYIKHLGGEGLRAVSEAAVLNANYLLSLLRKSLPPRYDRKCMHEFVVSGRLENDIRAIDVAKRLIDHGFYPPTIYFPLIVPEALMIEPTETESKEQLEAFADALISIEREAREEPAVVKSAPHNSPSERLDEVRAVKSPVLNDPTKRKRSSLA